MTGAPPLKNISELKAYLGVLNYYHSHLANLLNILEPPHSLMRKGTAWR